MLRALWRVLALVSVPGSIHYIVLPGLYRDDVLARAELLDLARAAAQPRDAAAWWRLARGGLIRPDFSGKNGAEMPNQTFSSHY